MSHETEMAALREAGAAYDNEPRPAPPARTYQPTTTISGGTVTTDGKGNQSFNVRGGNNAETSSGETHEVILWENGTFALFDATMSRKHTFAL
jgi:hypothetical protein